MSFFDMQRLYMNACVESFSEENSAAMCLSATCARAGFESVHLSRQVDNHRTIAEIFVRMKRLAQSEGTPRLIGFIDSLIRIGCYNVPEPHGREDLANEWLSVDIFPATRFVITLSIERQQPAVVFEGAHLNIMAIDVGDLLITQNRDGTPGGRPKEPSLNPRCRGVGLLLCERESQDAPGNRRAFGYCLVYKWLAAFHSRRSNSARNLG